MNRTGSCFAMFLQKRFSLVFFSEWLDNLPRRVAFAFSAFGYSNIEKICPQEHHGVVPRKKKHIISHHKCNSHHWWVSTDSSLLTDGQCPISVGYHLWLSIIIYACPLLSIVIHPQWFNSCVLFRNWFHFPFACFVGLQLPNSPPSSERRIHQRAVFENGVYTNQWPTDYHFSWKKWGFCRIKFWGGKIEFSPRFSGMKSHQITTKYIVP